MLEASIRWGLWGIRGFVGDNHFTVNRVRCVGKQLTVILLYASKASCASISKILYGRGMQNQPSEDSILFATVRGLTPELDRNAKYSTSVSNISYLLSRY